MSLRPDLTQLDYELLSAYIDNMLADSERVLLEERLARESGLRDELAALEQTVTLIAQLPALKAPRDFFLIPEMVSPKPRLTVVPQPSLNQRRGISLSLATVMSAAASMMLVALGVILLFSSEDSTTEAMVARAPETEVGLFSSDPPDDSMLTATVKSSPMPTVSILLAVPTDFAPTVWAEEGGRGQSRPDLQDQEEHDARAASAETQARDDGTDTNIAGAVPVGEQGIAGSGEAPLYAQVPAPMAGAEQEAPGAIALDSDNAASELNMLLTPSRFTSEPPPVPMATTVETYSAPDGPIVEDRERSAADSQILPSPTDLNLESAPPLAAMQPPSEVTSATALSEAIEDSVVDEGSGDDGVQLDLAEQPLLQTESSDSTQNNTLLGVLLIAVGCAMFVSLIAVGWLQRRRA